MNWLKLKVSGKDTLVNMELVTEIQSHKPYGCILHFKESGVTFVDESFEEVQNLLGVV